MNVVLVPVLSDNYVFVITSESGECAIVDPAVAAPVLAAAAGHVTHILNTHWHGDHVGGNREIVAATGAAVIGPAGEAARIPGLVRAVRGGDTVALLGTEAEVIDVPGHTAGHIAYYFREEGVLFVGDTLFGLGGGRLFEGTADEMWASMGRLAALPDDTRVYCAHEYTQSNGRFARSLAPDDPALAAHLAHIDALRAAGAATVPLTLGVERRLNPFLNAGTAAEYGRRRALKDGFRG